MMCTLPSLLLLFALSCSCMASTVAGFGPGTLEKGMIYVQPSYHYTNNLELDLAVLERDLVELEKAKFKNLGLRVSWGDIMPAWDPSTKTPTYNETTCARLGAIAEAATSHGMKLIFNMHLVDTVPRGIQGSYFVPSHGPDLFNVSGGDGTGVWRTHYLDAVVRDEYREPMTLFHTKFASCFKKHPDAPRFWKHSFESVYLFPYNLAPKDRTSGVVSAATTKFQNWAEATNSSIEHWQKR